MLKGYYVRSRGKKAFVGVDKKIQNQIKTFGENYEIKEIPLLKEPTNPIKSIFWRLPFGSFGRDYDTALKEIENPDFIYLRACYLDRRYMDFLKKLRVSHPKAKILFEIPTYPYDKELLLNKTEWPHFFKDRFHRKNLKKYVDRIVTFSEDKEIFGIPCITTRNGIRVDDVAVVEPKNIKDDTIRLLSVAQFQKSHGYERIIKSLAEYYAEGNKRRVELHMVGYGSEKKLYEELTRQYNLTDYVTFYGAKSGAELDTCYENMDAGLGCFGLYKKNIDFVSSLKSVEYMSKGLPVINGFVERIMEGGEQYFKLFDNADTPISMTEIVEFCDNLYKEDETHEKTAGAIHAHAKKMADMSVVMEPIFDYINA